MSFFRHKGCRRVGSCKPRSLNPRVPVKRETYCTDSVPTMGVRAKTGRKTNPFRLKKVFLRPKDTYNLMDKKEVCIGKSTYLELVVFPIFPYSYLRRHFSFGDITPYTSDPQTGFGVPSSEVVLSWSRMVRRRYRHTSEVVSIVQMTRYGGLGLVRNGSDP